MTYLLTFPKIVFCFILLVLLPHLELVSPQSTRAVEYSREWLTQGHSPDTLIYKYCKPAYTPPPPPPPPPTTTSTTTTTTTTTTTPTTTTDNSTATTSTTTTTTSTTSTSTTSTTTTTTTTTTRWKDSCPNQPSSIFTTNVPGNDVWWNVAEREPLKNWEHVILQMCPVYYSGMLFKKWTEKTLPDELDKLDSCLNPLSLDPFKWTAEKLELFAGHPLDLGPLKQRRVQLGTTNDDNPKIPFECPHSDLDPREKYCYACQTGKTVPTGQPPTPLLRDQDGNVIQQPIPEGQRGRIQPFAGKGETCTLENEAYLHGAVLMDVLDRAERGELKLPENKVYSGEEEEQEEGDFDDEPPWGRLNMYWPRLLNLNLAGIDNDNEDSPAQGPNSSPPDPACTTSDGATTSDDERVQKEIYYGDCIFNQRLATGNGKDDLKEGETLGYKHCYPNPLTRGPPTTTTTTTSTTTTSTTTTTEATVPAPPPPGTGRRRRSHPERHRRQAQVQVTNDPQYLYQEHDLTYDIPIVGLGCNPFDFNICNEEYNGDQMLESTCICNPMYSIPNPLYFDLTVYAGLALVPINEFFHKRDLAEAWSGQAGVPSDYIVLHMPCLPMAGVPCKFNTTGSKADKWQMEKYNFTFPCAYPDLMECVDLSNLTNPEIRTPEDKWKFLGRTFAGFGMSPIARDYMVERVTGVCMCKGRYTSHIQTIFNECVPREAGYMNRPSWILLVVLAVVAMLV